MGVATTADVKGADWLPLICDISPHQFIRVINREVPLFTAAANVLINKCNLNLATRQSATCLTSAVDIKVSQWRPWFRVPKDKAASGWEPCLFSPLSSVCFHLVGVLFRRGQSSVCSSLAHSAWKSISDRFNCVFVIRHCSDAVWAFPRWLVFLRFVQTGRPAAASFVQDPHFHAEQKTQIQTF